MRLSMFSDYALRVLMFMTASDEEIVRIAHISAAYRISHNHLMKVVSQLVRLDYLESVRGRGGGLRLSRDAATISVGQVVRDFETDLRLLDCQNCVMAPGCQLTCVLDEAMRAFLASLDAVSVADIISREAMAGGSAVGHRLPLFRSDRAD